MKLELELVYCKREMDLLLEKYARVSLACKGENAHSNVVF